MKTPQADAEIRDLADEISHANIRSIRHALLALAVREARQYDATAQEVLASFAARKVRPELQKDLDAQLGALGVPPHLAIQQAERVFTTGELDISDLMLLVQGYGGSMPTPAQAREIYEMAARLFKAARRHAKRVGQVQVIADSVSERERIDNPPYEPPPRTFHQTQARMVTLPGRGIGR